jgi:hypothetical protein
MNVAAKVGTPARSAADVVPAPPWWITPATRGRSQSCGAASSANTSSPSSPGSSAPQPVSSTARTRACRQARATSFVAVAGSRVVMLPKPMHTGFSPDARKSTSARGGCHVESCGRNQ